jgi:AcrR family transcriptional regulator
MQVKRPTAARLRSARTKRERSRAALLLAAEAVFREHGWYAGRMEEIARTAGVSVATAYNHFPGGKQELIGSVYAPFMERLQAAAVQDIAVEADPTAAVRRHVRDAVAMARGQLELTLPLVAAVQEQTIRVGGPPNDPRDVRCLVPFTTPLIDLIAYGQSRGDFRRAPAAAEVGAYHGNAILVRILTRPSEDAATTSELVLSQLMPSLIPHN